MLLSVTIVLFILTITTICVMATLTWSIISGAPYVRSSHKRIRQMIRFAKLRLTDRVVDLGSGDGRILATAAPHVKKAIGYERNPFLVLLSKIRFRNEPKVTVYARSLMRADLHQATVVFTYLMPPLMQQLTRKFRAELPPGARIISNGFPLPGWKPERYKDNVFLYIKY